MPVHMAHASLPLNAQTFPITRQFGLKCEVPQYGRQGKIYITFFSQNLIPHENPIYHVGESALHYRSTMGIHVKLA